MLQDAYWPDDGPGGTIRIETHFGNRAVRCFSDRHSDLAALFADVSARHASREALHADGESISYRELAARVERVAGNLAARGVGRGDRVAMLLGNCPEFLVVVLACAHLGAIAIPMGTRQAAAEVEHVLGDSGACAIVFEADYAAAVPAAQRTPACTLRVLAGSDPSPAAALEALPFGELLAPAAVPPRAAVHEDDCALILYTSGTTGKPKGAMLSHFGVIHSLIHFHRCFALEDGTRTLLAVPAAHVTGIVALLLTTLRVGGSTVMMRAFKAREFLRVAQDQAITYTLMVPAMYVLCLMDPEFERFDLSRWRVGGFGGSPMPTSAIEALATKLPGLVLHNAYGATETTSPTTLMPRGYALSQVDSVGQVVPCGEVLVVDERGKAVPPGTAGELLIRGPMIVGGYWSNPKANASNFVDGYWRSGDIGSIDERGFVRVFDRLKDMINRGGLKIFSAEVENVLSAHPDVLECAVVAVPDPVLGERVRAVLVARDGHRIDPTDVRAFCAQRLSDYKVPEIVDVATEPLPRNANGKVRKNLLRGNATPPAS